VHEDLPGLNKGNGSEIEVPNGGLPQTLAANVGEYPLSTRFL
jgi:hypothetical protein